MKKKFLIMLFFGLLSGCATSLTVKTSQVQLSTVQVPHPLPIALSNLSWKVLNISDIKILANKLKNSPSSSFSIYVLDSSGFTNLDNNLLEMRRYILEQKQVILFYQGLENNTKQSIKKN